jgi:glycosyltransferase involved in cell wall biosynthesis
MEPVLTGVLHIINGDLYAGAERVQDLLALNLGRHGYEVGFVSLKSGLFDRSRRAADAPLLALDMRNRIDFGSVPTIAKIVEAEGYRILHSHTPRSALIGALAASLAGVPLIHHVHGPTTQDTEHPVKNYRNSFVERVCVRKAVRAIAVSECAAEYARMLGVPRKKMAIVWNGVETPRERVVTEGTGQATLGAVALFRPRKGVEVLIKAIAKLADRRNRRVKLLMVGEFETNAYEEQIKTLARDLGVEDQIEWTGFTTDVEAMLRRMDIFVLPSLYGEGLPMVVLEAMALGLPIVSAAVGGVVEAIEHQRQGLLVPPGDAEAMSRALDELISDETLRTTLGNAARERQIERFSAAAMASGIAGIYDELLRNR